MIFNVYLKGSFFEEEIETTDGSIVGGLSEVQVHSKLEEEFKEKGWEIVKMERIDNIKENTVSWKGYARVKLCEIEIDRTKNYSRQEMIGILYTYLRIIIPEKVKREQGIKLSPLTPEDVDIEEVK